MSNLSNDEFRELFVHSESTTKLLKVFWDHELNHELTGYLSKMTGRNYHVDEIVLIDGITYNCEAERDHLLKNPAKKIDRKRSLVFLPESFLPDNTHQRISQTGFQKLEGTHFYISGSIEKFKDVRFKIWFVFDDKSTD